MIVDGRQRRKRVEKDDIVIVFRRVSRGIVLFNPRTQVIVERHRERARIGRVERDGGIKRPPNT